MEATTEENVRKVVDIMAMIIGVVSVIIIYGVSRHIGRGSMSRALMFFVLGVVVLTISIIYDFMYLTLNLVPSFGSVDPNEFHEAIHHFLMFVGFVMFAFGAHAISKFKLSRMFYLILHLI